jgi:hypothetical protein
MMSSLFSQRRGSLSRAVAKVFLSAAVVGASFGSPFAHATSVCTEAIQKAQTAAVLETQVLNCLTSRVKDPDIREALKEKRQDLLARPQDISHFFSQISPASQKLSGENKGLRRTSYLTSMTGRGIKPHIFHMGIESNNDDKVLNIIFEITDQPI